MQKVTIDYIFRTTPNILFKRLSTPSGLSEWFADDVMVNNGTYTFKWKDHSQMANYITDRKKLCIKLDWLDEDKEYLEFKIEESSISDDITLYITDFVEDDEDEDDAREFWDNVINRFKRKIGLK
ncbi:MAG: hypothetical protein JXR68_08210 [Bacteroidales bacterium]|nr:hypothetical protein [Bacteroidales bacterium]